jgi:hypothetical protein
LRVSASPAADLKALANRERIVVRRLIVPLVVLTGLAVPVPDAIAAALPGQTGTFGISPARRYVIGAPDSQLTPTTVMNSTPVTYDVSVFPALVRQSLSGAFEFSNAPRDLNESKLVLSPSPARFVLAPGGEQQVGLSWNLLPMGARWVAIGVIFQGIPRGQTGPFHVVERLLSVNFLRLPGPPRVDGVFSGLYPQQAGGRRLLFVARVQNTGTDFTAPSNGELSIRDGLGHTLLREPWRGQAILPGASVDFPIYVKRILPAGRYVATATMTFGRARKISVPFTLIGPNLLPTPAIVVHAFTASGTVGAPAKVSAKIASVGSAPATVTVHLYLGRGNQIAGQRALASARLTYPDLRPGSSVRINRPLGGALRPGSYRAFLTWRDPTGAPHTIEADFTAVVPQGFWAELWRFIKQHAFLWAALLVLAAVLVALTATHRLRRRQRRIEAELAVARAAASAVAALSGREHPPPPEGAAAASNGHGPALPHRVAVGRHAGKLGSGRRTGGAAAALTLAFGVATVLVRDRRRGRRH